MQISERPEAWSLRVDICSTDFIARKEFMGEQFKTDLHQLETFIRTLEGCVQELNDARTALAHVRADQIGTARLDGACDGFQERWKFGAEQTRKMIDAVSEGVRTNKKAYDEVEEAFEKAFQDIGKASTGSGGGGARQVGQ